jgi:hypothetical protein
LNGIPKDMESVGVEEVTKRAQKVKTENQIKMFDE